MNAKRFAQVLASTLGGLLFASMLILWLSWLPSSAQAASLSSPAMVISTNSGEPQITSNPPFTIYLPVMFKGFEECSTTPTLISPTNGSSLNTLIPLFQWDSGNNPNADNLHMEVSRNSGFTQIFSSLYYNSAQGAGDFRFSDNFNPAATIYWRAFLICGDTQGPYSEVWSFTTGSGGTLLPAPALVAPANGNAVPAITVTLRWSPVSGAVEYVVHWRTLGQGGYSYESVTDTQTTLTWLGPNPTYEWWVSARNNFAIGADSEKWQFTTPGGSSSVSTQNLNRSSVVEDGNAIIVFER
jgi:hypothetical protein